LPRYQNKYIPTERIHDQRRLDAWPKFISLPMYPQLTDTYQKQLLG
jgi:hypothetical protein